MVGVGWATNRPWLLKEIFKEAGITEDNVDGVAAMEEELIKEDQILKEPKGLVTRAMGAIETIMTSSMAISIQSTLKNIGLVMQGVVIMGKSYHKAIQAKEGVEEVVKQRNKTSSLEVEIEFRITNIKNDLR